MVSRWVAREHHTAYPAETRKSEPGELSEKKTRDASIGRLHRLSAKKLTLVAHRTRSINTWRLTHTHLRRRRAPPSAQR